MQYDLFSFFSYDLFSFNFNAAKFFYYTDHTFSKFFSEAAANLFWQNAVTASEMLNYSSPSDIPLLCTFKKVNGFINQLCLPKCPVVLRLCHEES